MKLLQWTTTHNTAQKTMNHVFHCARIMMYTDLNTGMAHVQKDGVALYTIDVSNMSLEEYTRELEKLAVEDERLSDFPID